ncbi:hypothetical protein FD755_024147, partial [Muntiacus reevesi]
VFEFGGPEVLKLQLDVAVPILEDHQVTFTTRTISGGYTEFAVAAHHTVHALSVKAGGSVLDLGTATTEEGQKLAFQNGAHEVFNHKEANHIDKIKKSVGIVVGHRNKPTGSMTKESSIKAQFAAALQTRMEIGWLKPVIGPRYSLEKAAQAHEDIIHSCRAMEK